MEEECTSLSSHGGSGTTTNVESSNDDRQQKKDQTVPIGNTKMRISETQPDTMDDFEAPAGNLKSSNQDNRKKKDQTCGVIGRSPPSMFGTTGVTNVVGARPVDAEDETPLETTLSRDHYLWGRRRNESVRVIVDVPADLEGRVVSMGGGIDNSPSTNKSVAVNEMTQPEIINTPFGHDDDDDDDTERRQVVVARLASDHVDIEARVAAQLETKVAERVEEMRRTAIVATMEGTLTDGWRKQHVWNILITMVFIVVVVAGIAGGMTYGFRRDDENVPIGSTETPTTPSSITPSSSPLDRLVDELRDFIAPNEVDLSLFRDPTTPQAQAIAWLQNDNITLTPGRSTRTVLERYVLMVLYFSTAGRGWRSQLWTSGVDICTWNGVNVLAGIGLGLGCQEDGVLTSLDLTYNNLRGTIPWEVGLLSNLTRIILIENRLTGSIPQQINYLNRLESLQVSSNTLTGPLPSLMFSSHMKTLDLSNNMISGTIPSIWGTAMSSMESLYLDGNTLNGTIPTTFGQLTNMQTMWLFSNMLTGTIPTELGLITTWRRSLSTKTC